MLPNRLERAVGPAETLLQEAAQRIRSLGKGHGLLVVVHDVAVPQQPQGEIRIFRQGVIGEAAELRNGLPPPRANRPGHNTNSVQLTHGAAVEIQAHDIFERLSLADESITIANLRVAGDCAYLGVIEVTHEFADGVGGDDGVGVQHDDDFSLGTLETVVDRLRLPLVRLGITGDARIPLKLRLNDLEGLVA